jgi:TATA box binding protein associated factor (TAF)
MACLRDLKIISAVTEQHGFGTVQEDAARLVLMEVELKIRAIIKEAIKYSRQFNRD